MTARKASLDPTRWPVVRPAALYNVLASLLFLAVGAFQLWSWASRVTQSSSSQDCQQYAFFFARIHLKSLRFRILKLVLYSLEMLVCVILLLIYLRQRKWVSFGEARLGTVHFWKDSSLWVDVVILAISKRRLFNSYNHFRVVVATVVVLATELRTNGTHSVAPTRCLSHPRLLRLLRAYVRTSLRSCCTSHLVTRSQRSSRSSRVRSYASALFCSNGMDRPGIRDHDTVLAHKDVSLQDSAFGF